MTRNPPRIQHFLNYTSGLATIHLLGYSCENRCSNEELQIAAILKPTVPSAPSTLTALSKSIIFMLEPLHVLHLPLRPVDSGITCIRFGMGVSVSKLEISGSAKVSCTSSESKPSALAMVFTARTRPVALFLALQT